MELDLSILNLILAALQGKLEGAKSAVEKIQISKQINVYAALRVKKQSR